MPIKLNTASGGGVILQGANTASDKTITIPADDGTMIYANSSGNVGIGTSSPLSTAMLEVSRSTTVIPTATVTADNQVTGWRVRRTGGTYPREWYLGIRENSTALDIYDNTADALRARIDSSGNLLVGTTAGTYRLNVKHTDNNQLWLDNDGSTSTGMVYANNGTSKVSAYWHNSLARYYITAVSAGVYLASGGTSWTSASDERVKDIVEPIDNAIEKLSNWRTVIGKYKTDEEGTRRSFLIAQDVQETFPEAVDSSNTEEFGLRYQDTIPLLVKAIQELKAEVDSLRAQVEAK